MTELTDTIFLSGTRSIA